MAGVVVAAGRGATKFSVGDEVFGCLEGCGKGGLAAGAFAEYVCAKETNLAPKSSAISFEEAAALPMAAVTALQAVRDYAKITQGQTVLINGASGGVGLFAAQIVKAYGAKVTGVCGTGSVDIVRSLGIDVINYKKENAVRDTVQYDAVIDVAATLSAKDYRRALKPNCICVVIGFSTIGHTISYNLARKRDGKKIVLCAANNKNGDDLLEVSSLVETGKIKVSIDSRFPLSKAADALRRVETGHPKGKVIIEIKDR
jgi:NADPH:quinone reductase-like Zn-dependent oxidoreductase